MNRPASLLVVDDNEANRDALSRRLRQHGYDATTAADGMEALTLLPQSNFDLVLLDVEMPGLSGFDVLKQLRATYSRTKLPVIMVTARTAGEDVVEALKIGANDYLTKPIDFQVALARIETHLAHKRAVEDLRDSEERYALAVHGANDGLWDWNLVTGQVYWSPRWRSILGLESNEVSADPNEWLMRVHPEDAARVQSTLKEHLSHGSGHFESEHRVRHTDDTYRWVLCRGAAVRNPAGVATRFAGSLTDITEAKLADALTGLPNRFLFLDVVERAIARVERKADYGFAILVLTLDRFRIVHDSLGAAAADRLLVAVARRLQAGLRATDVVTRDEPGVTLARLGGDEFNVLVDDITDASDAVAVAERLRRALEAPFEIDGHQLFASARIGIAVSTTGYVKAEEILRDATIALNRAVGLIHGAVRNFRSGNAAEGHDAADGGNRSAPRHRQPELRGALPADHLAAERPHRRVRGAGAVAPPGARAGAAERLHRHCRGHRHDRRHRPADDGGIVPADGGVDVGLWRRGAGRDVRQRVEQAAGRQGADESDRRRR